jgi:hypothetical protein
MSSEISDRAFATPKVAVNFCHKPAIAAVFGKLSSDISNACTFKRQFSSPVKNL